jgi:hypothetical protein
MLLLASTKEAAKRKNGRRNEVPSLKAMERESLGVKVNPRRSQVKHLSNKIAAVDVKARGIGPAIVVPRNT